MYTKKQHEDITNNGSSLEPSTEIPLN
jgi:hypothetical protein